MHGYIFLHGLCQTSLCNYSRLKEVSQNFLVVQRSGLRATQAEVAQVDPWSGTQISCRATKTA